MATWTTIPDSSLEPGKPIRSIDALALRDNPVAIAEGASGATRIRLGALQALTAGTDVQYRHDEERVFPGPIAQVPINSFGFIQSGTIRVSLDHASDTQGTTTYSYVTRTRSGVKTTLVTWSTTSSTYTTRTIDVSVIPGDIVSVEVSSSSSTHSIKTRNIRMQTAGEEWWPVEVNSRKE